MKFVNLAVACSFLVVVAHAQQLPPGTPVGGSVGSGRSGGGIRDPFVAPLRAKKELPILKPRTTANLSDVPVMAVSVKGILRSASTLIAVLEVPGGKSFIVRVKDRLRDGIVKAIDFEGVILAMTLADSGGSSQSRDIRKPLKLSSEASR